MNFVELKSGKSVEGDEIKAFRSELKGPRYLYLMAGVHGDEVEGVYALQQMFEWLKQQDDLDFPTIVIPVLNPDGYRSGSRTNSHGVDLNRNLPAKSWVSEQRSDRYNPGQAPLSEPENQFLDKLFQKFPPHLIITLHSWKPMINYNGDCKDVADLLNLYNSYPVVADIEGHPTPGSLGDYGPEKYQSPVLTFEFPVIDDNNDLKSIWEENRIGFETLLQSDLVRAQTKSS